MMPPHLPALQPLRPDPARGWSVIATTVRGSGHARSGDPCQDAYQWIVSFPEGLLAAVADGAGSTPLGGVGASLASATAVDLLHRKLDPRKAAAGLSFAKPAPIESLLRETFIETRAMLEREATIRNAPLRDFASTLLLTLATPQGIALGQIGDGALVIRRDDDTLDSLSVPGESEHINETVFLTATDALDRLRIVTRAEPVAQLALFSDGLQLLALRLADFTPHAPFFRPLFRFAAAPEVADAAEHLAAFLKSPRVTGRTDDDLTLLLATVREPAHFKAA